MPNWSYTRLEGIVQENYGNEKEKICSKGFITESCLEYPLNVLWKSTTPTGGASHGGLENLQFLPDYVVEE